MKKKILFLGYTTKKTILIPFLRKKNFFVRVHGQKLLTFRDAKSYDLIISFGYNKILKKNILEKISRPPINLHISYLPYNKGSDPNFWSFIKETPKGVSIHEINEGIDKGGIIARKKVNFKLDNNLTFSNTYQKLIIEVQNLFKRNFKKIINNEYKLIKPKSEGSYHKKKDLPKNLKNWNIVIKKYLKKTKLNL